MDRKLDTSNRPDAVAEAVEREIVERPSADICLSSGSTGPPPRADGDRTRRYPHSAGRTAHCDQEAAMSTGARVTISARSVVVTTISATSSNWIDEAPVTRA